MVETAWFTDSQDAALYKIPIGRNGAIGRPVRVPLTGEYQHQPSFNSTASRPRDGRWLIVIQSSTGLLCRVDARFSTPPTPSTAYTMVSVRRP